MLLAPLSPVRNFFNKSFKTGENSFLKIETKDYQSYIIHFHTETVDLMNSLLNDDLNIFRVNTHRKYSFDVFWNWMQCSSNYELYHFAFKVHVFL